MELAARDQAEEEVIECEQRLAVLAAQPRCNADGVPIERRRTEARTWARGMAAAAAAVRAAREAAAAAAVVVAVLHTAVVATLRIHEYRRTLVHHFHQEDSPQEELPTRQVVRTAGPYGS